MEEDDVEWRAVVEVDRDHPDALVRNCVTKAGEMHKLALYKDEERRLYRPRQVLTEDDNRGRKTQKHESEPTACFDVYIRPLNKIQVAAGERKALPLRLGDKVVLHTTKDRVSDKVTVKEFTGYVSEINWGTLKRTEPNGRIIISHNPNMGFVKLDIPESFDRSLLIAPESEIKKRRVVAA